MKYQRFYLIVFCLGLICLSSGVTAPPAGDGAGSSGLAKSQQTVSRGPAPVTLNSLLVDNDNFPLGTDTLFDRNDESVANWQKWIDLSEEQIELINRFRRKWNLPDLQFDEVVISSDTRDYQLNGVNWESVDTLRLEKGAERFTIPWARLTNLKSFENESSLVPPNSILPATLVPPQQQVMSHEIDVDEENMKNWREFLQSDPSVEKVFDTTGNKADKSAWDKLSDEQQEFVTVMRLSLELPPIEFIDSSKSELSADLTSDDLADFLTADQKKALDEYVAAKLNVALGIVSDNYEQDQLWEYYKNSMK